MDKARRIAYDVIGDVQVSTVFLGIDHNYSGKGPPVLFETMVLGGPRNDTTFRYSSWDDAEVFHFTTSRKGTAGSGFGNSARYFA